MKQVWMTLRFLTMFAFLWVVGAASYCQTATVKGETGSFLVISEAVLLSWGVVLVLVAVTATAITNFVESKLHRANKEIHIPAGELAKSFTFKEECKAKHDEVKADFKGVHQRLDGIQGDVQFIRGKLEDKK